ncbi:MAG: hypothetical protein ACLS7Z_11930 [Christensenellales bacterium]
MTVADITPDEPYTMHAGVIRAFIDHILTGAPMIADGREGLNSLMLANAMLLRAGRTKRSSCPDARATPTSAALRPEPEKDREADRWTSANVLTSSRTTQLEQSLHKRSAMPLRVRRNLLPRWK